MPGASPPAMFIMPAVTGSPASTIAVGWNLSLMERNCAQVSRRPGEYFRCSARYIRYYASDSTGFAGSLDDVADAALDDDELRPGP
jgi:hypothetical protein